METERIALSQRERDRLKVLHEVKQKHLTQVEAAARLKVTDRQVRRMLLRIRERGDGALVHGLRGRPSNRKLAARFEQKILARLRNDKKTQNGVVHFVLPREIGKVEVACDVPEAAVLESVDELRRLSRRGWVGGK